MSDFVTRLAESTISDATPIMSNNVNTSFQDSNVVESTSDTSHQDSQIVAENTGKKKEKSLNDSLSVANESIVDTKSQPISNIIDNNPLFTESDAASLISVPTENENVINNEVESSDIKHENVFTKTDQPIINNQSINNIDTTTLSTMESPVPLLNKKENTTAESKISDEYNEQLSNIQHYDTLTKTEQPKINRQSVNHTDSSVSSLKQTEIKKSTISVSKISSDRDEYSLNIKNTAKFVETDAQGIDNNFKRESRSSFRKKEIQQQATTDKDTVQEIASSSELETPIIKNRIKQSNIQNEKMDMSIQSEQNKALSDEANDNRPEIANQSLQQKKNKNMFINNNIKQPLTKTKIYKKNNNIVEDNESHSKIKNNHNSIVKNEQNLLRPSPMIQRNNILTNDHHRTNKANTRRDIKINIGRLEVRANNPQPPMTPTLPQPTAVTPPLSLTEYLNQRSRG